MGRTKGFNRYSGSAAFGAQTSDPTESNNTDDRLNPPPKICRKSTANDLPSPMRGREAGGFHSWPHLRHRANESDLADSLCADVDPDATEGGDPFLVVLDLCLQRNRQKKKRMLRQLDHLDEEILLLQYQQNLMKTRDRLSQKNKKIESHQKACARVEAGLLSPKKKRKQAPPLGKVQHTEPLENDLDEIARFQLFRSDSDDSDTDDSDETILLSNLREATASPDF